MRRISLKSEAGSEKTPDLNAFSDELRDTFYSNNKNKSVFHVRLNSSGLLLQRNTSSGNKKDHYVKICDIIGGRCVWLQKPNRMKTGSTCGVCTPNVSEKQNSNFEKQEDAYLYVFAYVLKKNIRNVIRRERTVITLRFRSFDSHEDNMREAEKWCKSLKSYRDKHLKLCGVFDNSSRTLTSKRLLILLNPKSGSGKSRELFHQHVVPVLNEAEIPYDLYVTKHSHYAANFVRQRDLSVWSGIVAIGGDGLFHEILNGLLLRHDWKRVVENISLGIVPCGSGNGLARSIAHSYQEPYDPKPILGAALTLVDSHSSPMDVVEIELDNRVIYSFLSVGWGLISDIDIESERLRPLGYQRFTIWTLHRLINLRTYRGRISYLPISKISANVPETGNMQPPLSRITLQHSVSCNTFPPTADLINYKSSEHVVDPDFEDVISLETLANNSFRSRCGSWLSSGSRKSTYYSIADSIYHSISGNSECNDLHLQDEDIMEDHQYIRMGQAVLNESPSLCDSLPDTWIVQNGEFVMIHAVYQTHLGSDCHFSPFSKLNDGTIYLVIIRGGISRSQLFNFLINMSSGTHLPTKNTEFIQVERVEAFRLEPDDDNGILTVDGERIQCGSLQARIFPGAVNVMVPHNDTIFSNINVAK